MIEAAFVACNMGFQFFFWRFHFENAADWFCRPGHQSRQEQVEKVAEPEPSEPLKEVCLGSGWEVEAGSKMFEHLLHGIAR